MPTILVVFLIYLGGCYARLVARAPVSISPPASVPSNASPNVPVSFPGFAFDSASFGDYAGPGGNANTYSQNLIAVVSSRTNTRPILRVGGTNGDSFTYVKNQAEPINDGKVGPSYFRSFNNFPGAKYIFQVPLHNDGDVTNTVAFAKAGLRVITNANLQAIEIGNEPSAYYNSAEQYVNNFLKYENAITKNIPTIPTGPIFQAVDGGSETAATNAINPISAFKSGINGNGRIKTCADHYYQDRLTAANPDLQSLLMNHTAITSRLNTYAKFVNYINTQQKPIPFILSEVGNSLTPGEGGPYRSFQSVLGSALWAVDFQLYAMTLGVRRVNMQQKTDAGFNLWQPVTTSALNAGTQAPFYAQPYIAEFLSTSGQTRVYQLSQSSDTFQSAYAAYDNSKLARIAIVNLKLWENKGQRPGQTYSIKVPTGTKSVRVERLTSPNGGRARGDSVSWAGLQWLYENNGMKSGTQKTEKVNVMSGRAVVKVNASEAVIVYLQ